MKILVMLFFYLGTLLCSCNNGAVSWNPHFITDTGDVVITCDGTKGNRGLYNYKGDVYVHIGAVTDLSGSPFGWRYVKYTWGSAVAPAKMQASGENKWSYTIRNIRRFFDVPDDEKILKIAILFRSGNCIDSCYALRNSDDDNFYIPVNDVHVP
jgi:hypothetical protein